VNRVRDRAAEPNSGSDLRARLARLHLLARAAVGYAGRQLSVPSAGIVRRRGLPQHDVFVRLHRRVLDAYHPVPYAGRTLVFASPRYLEASGPALDELFPPESVGGQRHDVPISGEHLDLVREPNVAEVARALDVLLADAPS
jgi:thioesterase domain-containing protein